MLYAALSDHKREQLFTLSDPGVNNVQEKGSNIWMEQLAGIHYVLGLREDPEQVTELIENLMTSR